MKMIPNTPGFVLLTFVTVHIAYISARKYFLLLLMMIYINVCINVLTHSNIYTNGYKVTLQ